MKSVDAYIEGLAEDKAQLCQQIRELILASAPGITEKLSFKIPFYHFHGMFCYLNAVKAGIDVCFMRGLDLVELFPQLEQKGRKIVASVTIASKTDIQRLALPEIILTAASWNEEAARTQKTFLTRQRVRKSSPTSSGKKSGPGRR